MLSTNNNNHKNSYLEEERSSGLNPSEESMSEKVSDECGETEETPELLFISSKARISSTLRRDNDLGPNL
jgi:hypothetical protein